MMKNLSRFHPAAVCAYFLCVQLPVVFGINPVTAGTALPAGLLLWFVSDERATLRGAAFYLALPVISGAINPVFNHNGVTVLFFLNGNPVTREAVLYGAALGLVISAALLWARCFTAVMDTDRILCVLGRLNPRLSLVLSMTLRYIPLLRRQTEKTREAGRAVGLIREENAPDRIRGGARIFSGLVTWALENGAVTADSMVARGYGSGRRSRYRLYPWTRSDTVLAVFSAAMLLGVLAARLSGSIGYTWYPVFRTPAPGAASLAAYTAFAVLCLAGPALNLAERWVWHRRMMHLPGEENSHG